MNVGELMQRLSTYPADMPVVVDAGHHDGIDYEVMAVDVAVMQHEIDEDWPFRAYHQPGQWIPAERYAPAQDVVYLRLDEQPDSMGGGQA